METTTNAQQVMGPKVMGPGVPRVKVSTFNGQQTDFSCQLAKSTVQKLHLNSNGFYESEMSLKLSRLDGINQIS